MRWQLSNGNDTRWSFSFICTSTFKARELWELSAFGRFAIYILISFHESDTTNCEHLNRNETGGFCNFFPFLSLCVSHAKLTSLSAIFFLSSYALLPTITIAIWIQRMYAFHYSRLFTIQLSFSHFCIFFLRAPLLRRHRPNRFI